MIGRLRLAGSFVVLTGGSLLLGCESSHSQIIVVIDAQEGIREAASLIDVVVHGRPATGTFPPSGDEGQAVLQRRFVLSQAEGQGDAEWPLTIALAPLGNDATRLFRLVATARSGAAADSAPLATARIISGYVRGEVRMVRLLLLDACEGVFCETPADDPLLTCQCADEACSEPACVPAMHDARQFANYDRSLIGRIDRSCIDSHCDDGVDCTRDSCGADGCVHELTHELCSLSPDGRCDKDNGCQYEACAADTCMPTSGCQRAFCTPEGRCIRESLCASGETCCNGECVPAGCSDGIGCTVDRCGSNGCENHPDDSACDDDNACTTDTCSATAGCAHEPNSAPCDDGTFCNGADTCSEGACTIHAGDLCEAPTVCDEARGACVGCTRDGDCPAQTAGPWGTCSWDPGMCSETGTQERTVTTYACNDGSCVANAATESRTCSRDTDGTTCGTSACELWSACDWADACAEVAMRTRSCMDLTCRDGTCEGSTRTELESCERDTDGEPCGSSGSCQGGTCVENMCCDGGTFDSGQDSGSYDSGTYDSGGATLDSGWGGDA